MQAACTLYQRISRFSEIVEDEIRYFHQATAGRSEGGRGAGVSCRCEGDRQDTPLLRPFGCLYGYGITPRVRHDEKEITWLNSRVLEQYSCDAWQLLPLAGGESVLM